MLYLNGVKVGFVGVGHSIKNDSGTILTNRNNLLFKGIYTKDDSTNNNTEIDIVREFNDLDDIEALTGEEAKGFQHIDDDVYDAFTASDIAYDSNTSVKEAIDGVSVLSIPANTYSTWGQALSALGTAYDTLTQAQKERSYLLWDGRLKLLIQDMTSSNKAFSFVAVGVNSITVRSMFIASTPYYLVGTQTGSSQTIDNNTNAAQTQSIELKY